MIKKTIFMLLGAYVLTVVAWFGVLLLFGSGPEGGGISVRFLLLGLGGAVVLFGVFTAIGIGVVVFVDAKTRGMEPIVWALVAALVPYFLGLIAYLVVRKPQQDQCLECGAPVRQDASFCAACGRGFRKVCPGCGASTQNADRYCAGCGVELTAAATANP